MTPLASLTKYNLGLLDVVDDEKKLLNFLRMEKWLADRPHHPGEAAKQWLKDLYQQNKLVKNQFELGGRKVELVNITMPVLNVYAKEDHIIPPQCSRALAECVGTDDYSEIGLAGRARRCVRERQIAGRPRQRHCRVAQGATVTFAAHRRRAVSRAQRRGRLRELAVYAIRGAAESPVRGVPRFGPAWLHASGLHGMGIGGRRANRGLRARADAQQPRLRLSRRNGSLH